MNVIVTGSLGYDYIMNFPGRFADRIMPDKIHQISLSFLVDKLEKQMGGTAGNIAYTLKLLGVDPYIVASAGNDFGPYKAYMKKRNIVTAGIAVHDDVPTSSYFVVTDKDDNQIGSFFIGAMQYANKLSVQVGYLQKTIRRNKDTPFVIIAPTDPAAMKKYVKECRDAKLPYLYDPAFQIATFSKEELKEGIEGARILIGNDYEIALIEDKLEISHEELIMMVPILVTTLGPKGAIIETRHESIGIKPAKPTKESDPTGAGDAFRAGFIAGYLHEYDLQICGQMGAVAAVYTVESYGTQTHTFTKKEFAERYKKNYNSSISL